MNSNEAYRKAARQRQAAQTLMNWFREPDYAERVDLDWLLDWINRRPLAEVHALAERHVHGRPKPADAAKEVTNG